MSGRQSDVENLFAAFADQRIDRRHLLERALALGFSAPIAAALVAACGGASKEGAGVQTAQQGTTPAAAPAGGKLTIRATHDLSNVDPANWVTHADEALADSIYEGLITYKPGTFDVVNTLADT